MNYCGVCGKAITRPSPKAKYCSSACKYKAYRKGLSQKPVMMNCEVCGEEFLSKVNAKYCSRKCNSQAYDLRHPGRRKEVQDRYRLKSGRSKTLYREGMMNKCVECCKKFHPMKDKPFMKFCSDVCRSRYTQRHWQKDNPERTREIMRKYDNSDKGKARRERRFEKIKIYQKEWRKNNPGKSSGYSKRWRDKNPEKAKDVLKKYQQSLRGKFLNRKRSLFNRAKIHKNFDHNVLIKIVAEQNNRCPLCNKEYENYKQIELGHIFPLSKFPALAADLENIHPICEKCNGAMKNDLFADFCIEHHYPIPKRVIDYIKKQKTLLEF